MEGLPPFLIQTYQESSDKPKQFSVTAPESFRSKFSSALVDEHKEEIRRLWESSGFSNIENPMYM
jgi:hypothetical protein